MELEARRIQGSLDGHSYLEPADEAYARFQEDLWHELHATGVEDELWYEPYAAGGDDDLCDGDAAAWQSCEEEAATAHDSMQVPTSATGHEEEAQATATGQEKKSAATGDNEQALVEAQGSATGKRTQDDKPLLDPPEIDDETGPIWDADKVAGWIPGAFPSIFQNETGDPYNMILAKPDLTT